MWCLFECGTWLWPNLINWLFVVALPSITLGKEAFCRVPGLKHSAKCTRGKMLCVLGLKWLLCRVSALWHSARKPKFYAFWDGFAECLECDTWQRWWESGEVVVSYCQRAINRSECFIHSFSSLDHACIALQRLAKMHVVQDAWMHGSSPCSAGHSDKAATIRTHGV